MEKTKIDAAEIGRRLRHLRGIRTRTGVARQLGISPSRLGNYELGINRVPDDMKQLIASYYGVSVQDLFYGIEYHETY